MQTNDNTAKPVQKQRSPLQKVGRVLLKVVLFLLLFIVVLFLLLLTPPVQQFAAGRVENYLQQKLKTEVEIGSIGFNLGGNINLKGIYVEDQEKDTLVYGGLIRANLNIWKLFSNEVEVRYLNLSNVTAKIKRVLPDTTFNFQFIVDAFITEKTSDTVQTTPLKLSLDKLNLENVSFLINDVITGNNMQVRVGNLNAWIDSIDLTKQHYGIDRLDVKKLTARIKQFKPLVEPQSLEEDVAEAAEPVTMDLAFGTVDLREIDVNYANDISAFYTLLNIGKLRVKSDNLDLKNNLVHLDEVVLDNSTTIIRMGKSEQAKVVEEEAKKEVDVQQQKGWKILVDQLALNNNVFEFENENEPRQPHGMDFAHLRSEDLTLHARDIVMDTDSFAAKITKGQLREKSGFQLNKLEGEILYASNQFYLKNLLVKTPGTELKRQVVMEYPSFDALMNKPEQVVMDIDLINSQVQVKDILAFAPQFRNHPAFRNPNDIWNLNIQASGNMDRLHVEALQFDGLKDTYIDASGTLASLSDPNQAGGNFTIRRLRTSQTDLELLAGQSLSNEQVNLPETFEASGTLSGNAANLKTNLVVRSSAGFIALDGRFGNLTNPDKAQYAAHIRTNDLNLGSIMRDAVPVGTLSANLTIDGKGFTPGAMYANFNGIISSVGYNNYQYQNIQLSGKMNGNDYSVNTDINDPNIDLTLTATGNISENPSLVIDGFIDSLKTQPLNFSTQPIVFRGKIDGNFPSLDPNALQGNLLVTNLLLVSDKDRLSMDSLYVVAGRNDSGQFIRLNSDIARAELSGQYQLADLAAIFQDNIQPYFSVTPYQSAGQVAPYDFSITADVQYHPIFGAFVPGFEAAETIHAEARLATSQGMQASVATPGLAYQANKLNDVMIRVNTSDSGMRIDGNIGQLISGNALNMYNVQLDATALNNVVDFNVAVDDRTGKDKYFLGGVFKQPQTGTYVLSLKPNNLLLNYQNWTVSPNNSITLTETDIQANNFTLQKGNQQLSLQSEAGEGSPLNVRFSNFQLSTISGFMQSDSLFVDGNMNGLITLRNLMQQPVFTSDLTIRDLSFKQDTLGNVQANVSSSGNRYLTDVTITGQGNDIALTGSFAPEGTDDLALDLDLAIRQLQMATLQGALAGFLKSASGSVNGNISINGTASQPDVEGDINFNNTKLTTTMLGGPFAIDNETLQMTEKGFVFDQFTIRDSVNNTLTLDGEMLTSNFINYDFDLTVKAKDFRALSTSERGDNIYFGNMVVSTDLHIGGTEVAPKVDGSISINEGTEFTFIIPQPEPGVVQREGIVVFTDFDAPENDSLFLTPYDSLNVSNLTGFDIALNIEVKKEAIFNMIVDETNGDFLNLQGEAELSTGIDPSGKITMTGSYTIEKGAYEISFNFLRRRFEIEKGSSILWLGEPTNAQINVTAIYVANTAPYSLVESQISESSTSIRNTYLQKLPFEVHLTMSGELMKPQISFDIILPEDKNYLVSKTIVDQSQVRLAQIRQEPSEINKQVFSLLLLGRFVGENPFDSPGDGFSAGSFARQSVSRLLTEQLNKLAEGLIEGVDLTFDVTSTEDYTTGARRNRTDLNVGLSKQLLNDRLTVTVGSNFELEGPQQANQRGTNLAGNVSLQYQLSRDGRYMLRGYRKNEYQGVIDGYIIETGMSFVITLDYENFRDLIGRKKKVEGVAENKTDGTNEQ